MDNDFSIFVDYDRVKNFKAFFKATHENGPLIRNFNGYTSFLMRHFEEFYKRRFLKLVWGNITRHFLAPQNLARFTTLSIKSRLTTLESVPINPVDLLILIAKYRIMWYALRITYDVANDINSMLQMVSRVFPYDRASKVVIPLLVMWRDCYLKEQFMSHYDHHISVSRDGTTITLPKIPDFILNPDLLEEEIDALFRQQEPRPPTKRDRSRLMPCDENAMDTDSGNQEEEDEERQRDVYLGGWKYTGLLTSLESLETKIINPFLHNTRSSVDLAKLQQACVSDTLMFAEDYEYGNELGKRNLLPSSLLEVLQDHYPSESALSLTKATTGKLADLFPNLILNGHAHNFLIMHIFNAICVKQCDLDFLESCCAHSRQFHEDIDLALRDYEAPRIVELKNEFFVCFRTILIVCTTAKQAFVIWVLVCKLYCDSIFDSFADAISYDILFLEQEIISSDHLTEILP
jgi:hypothetical protein